jgi:hypothetical protein
MAIQTPYSNLPIFPSASALEGRCCLRPGIGGRRASSRPECRRNAVCPDNDIGAAHRRQRRLRLADHHCPELHRGGDVLYVLVAIIHHRRRYRSSWRGSPITRIVSCSDPYEDDRLSSFCRLADHVREKCPNLQGTPFR